MADTDKAAWVAPEIRTLDVGETYSFNHRGGDGNARYADSTKS